MRERINDKGRLRHILSSVNIILDNKDRFNLEKNESDPIVFFGFVKQLEIIGEAVGRILKVLPDLQLTNARKIVDTRNRISHGYDSVSDDIIWAIVIRDISKLETEVAQLLADNGGAAPII